MRAYRSGFSLFFSKIPLLLLCGIFSNAAFAQAGSRAPFVLDVSAFVDLQALGQSGEAYVSGASSSYVPAGVLKLPPEQT